MGGGAVTSFLLARKSNTHNFYAHYMLSNYARLGAPKMSHLIEANGWRLFFDGIALFSCDAFHLLQMTESHKLSRSLDETLTARVKEKMTKRRKFRFVFPHHHCSGALCAGICLLAVA